MDAELDQSSLTTADDKIASLLSHIRMLELPRNEMLVAKLRYAERLMEVVFDGDGLKSFEAHFEWVPARFGERPSAETELPERNLIA